GAAQAIRERACRDGDGAVARSFPRHTGPSPFDEIGVSPSKRRLRILPLFATAAVALSAILVSLCARRAEPNGRAATAHVPSSPETPAPPRAPPEPPRRVRHDGALVPLDTGAAKKTWIMHETAPLIEPDEEPRPITLLLHGMCSDPKWTCDWFQY